MQPAKALRERAYSRQLTLGLLAIDHVWTDLVELSIRGGFDYLIVCMEHGAADAELVAEVCATGRRLNFPILVRPRANDYNSIRLAVDLGPCGFLLACVESPDDLDVVRDALYVPPRGRRRPGGMGNRWVPDYLAATWQSAFECDFVVLPQIETRRGLDNVDGIARHELTTAVAVGPDDLSGELGVGGQLSSPVLKQALSTVRAAAERADKPAWMIGADVAGMVREGWRFLCAGEPSWMLVGAMRAQVEAARNAAANG